MDPDFKFHVLSNGPFGGIISWATVASYSTTHGPKLIEAWIQTSGTASIRSSIVDKAVEINRAVFADYRNYVAEEAAKKVAEKAITTQTTPTQTPALANQASSSYHKYMTYY